MMLKRVKNVQLVWASLFLVTFGLKAMDNHIENGSWDIVAIYALWAAIYFIASLICQFDNRIAWWVAIAMPIGPLFIYLPIVCINGWMFISGHDLYQDSPATIFVVAIYALIYVAPALYIYLKLFTARKVLAAILFRNMVQEECAEEKVVPTSLSDVRKIQLLWAALMLFYYSTKSISRFSEQDLSWPYFIVLAVVMLIYFFATLGCFSDNRAAWRIAIALPLVPFVWHVYYIGWSLHMTYVRSHHWLDYPTYSIGAIAKSYLFIVIPTLCLYYLLFKKRTELKERIF